MKDSENKSLFPVMSREEMIDRGWESVDFVYVTGDAYVDHPSFGTAVIARVLEANGYSVGIIAQPDWHNPESIAEFGEPRLGFLVSAGNMDSMVNHYTVAKRRRGKDAYSPGGKAGKRPDRAVIVYCNLIRQLYKKTPIIIGGIEASLRRFAHYDYWSDSMRRSILLDSGADIISYGMGERSIVEIADALDSGLDISDLTFIDGTVYRCKLLDHVVDPVILPSWEDVSSNRLDYAKSFAIQYENSDHFSASTLVEPYERQGYIIQNIPAKPLSQEELDAVYRLPFTGRPHPSYDRLGGVPASAEVRFSLQSSRGCFGECAFCAIAFHQGRVVQARSEESLIAEAQRIVNDPDFKGYIHDVGGPTANFYGPACDKQLKSGACKHRRCISPKPCKRLKADHSGYIKLLRRLRSISGVKKVFVRSGIRFDYAMLDRQHGKQFIKELANHHVSGQLRLAPEHVSGNVLNAMGKPSIKTYKEFVAEFDRASKAAGKEQYVLPYLMSSHPGSGLKEAVELAEFCRDLGYNPEQVQDFYPTPSTMATVMYATGVDPRTMKPVYVARSPHEKALQRALIQYRNPKNRKLVMEALQKAGRIDLIGYGPKCLIRPDNHRGNPKPKGLKNKRNA